MSHYYSTLKDSHIDEETYSDIHQFWTKFGCSSMADYSSYYVSLDTILLR